VTKRIPIYARVSTADQHPETQLLDLRQMAKHADTRSCTSTPILFLARNRDAPVSINFWLMPGGTASTSFSSPHRQSGPERAPFP
jgi:hypothetical protein